MSVWFNCLNLRSVMSLPGMKKLLLAYLVVAAAVVGAGVVAIQQLDLLSDSKDAVILNHTRDLLGVEGLRITSEREGRKLRSLLLTGDESFVGEIREERVQLRTDLEAAAAHVETDEGRRLLLDAQAAERAFQAVVTRVLELRRTASSRVHDFFEQQVRWRRLMRAPRR